jgi:hypothetical protein
MGMETPLVENSSEEEKVTMRDLYKGLVSGEVFDEPLKEKKEIPSREYTEEELNEKDPLTGKPLHELLEKRKDFKKEKPQKTPEEKAKKNEKKERERRMERVDDFLKRVINSMETLAEFKNSGFNFEEKLEDWRKAKEDVKKGKFEKAKKLIHKEMKHARLAGAIDGDNGNFQLYSGVYTTIENLENEK